MVLQWLPLKSSSASFESATTTRWPLFLIVPNWASVLSHYYLVNLLLLRVEASLAIGVTGRWVMQVMLKLSIRAKRVANFLFSFPPPPQKLNCGISPFPPPPLSLILIGLFRVLAKA